jgi:predicted nucleic acid-binding Zn finger protein
LVKKIMRKLLLLDADVVMDLHTLGLFGKIKKAYDVYVTRTVLEEARYYKKDGRKYKIEIKDLAIIEDIDLEILKSVQKEAREARLGVDPGESTSIAYLVQTETDITFCTCDQAAIKLIAYMELERKAISLEKALRTTGYHGKNLYPRHYEKTFRKAVKEGKSLRIQFKKWK